MIKKNVWEAVGKNLGFETGEAATAKKCFHQSSNKVCERKEELKRLKKVGHRCEKSNESRKEHAGLSFPQLVGQFYV